jgi:hypothetical protein
MRFGIFSRINCILFSYIHGRSFLVGGPKPPIGYIKFGCLRVAGLAPASSRVMMVAVQRSHHISDSSPRNSTVVSVFPSNTWANHVSLCLYLLTTNLFLIVLLLKGGGPKPPVSVRL